MSFPAYAEYKDSGVEWLGEVPEGWVVDRFKRSTVSCRNGIWGSEAQGDENDIKCVRVADFDRESRTTCDDIPTIRNVTESERAERTLSQGNLLLEKSGGGDLQPVGFVVLYDSNEPAVCSNFVAKVELADGMNPSYWRYCHAAAYSIRLNYRSIKQTSGIQNLDQSQYLDERASFPPLDEQTAIASFLDTETTKIDSLVHQQRRLIELLKEKRQAVISHAVTKGLDPSVKMKPSGIQWLGDVPEGWEVGRLNHLVSTRKGVAFKANDFIDEGIDVVKASDIKEMTIRTPSTFLPPEFVSEYPKAVLEANDLVLSTVGSTPEVRNSAVGQLGRVPGNLAGSLLNQNTVVFSPNEETLTNDFLYYLIQTTGYRDHLDLHAHGTANQASLNVSDMLHIQIPLPAPTEQVAISEYLQRIMALMDDLSTEAERAIELLQERRTALISAAVTGKIDVRQFATEAVA